MQHRQQSHNVYQDDDILNGQEIIGNIIGMPNDHTILYAFNNILVLWDI
jgi:hypothetical protein